MPSPDAYFDRRSPARPTECDELIEQIEAREVVEKLLSEDELSALGNELLVMFESLIEREPRKLVPSETIAAAPLV